jgi:ankyrin repeat protein
VVEYLISNGASPLAIDHVRHNTALHWAANYGRAECVARLLGSRATYQLASGTVVSVAVSSGGPPGEVGGGGGGGVGGRGQRGGGWGSRGSNSASKSLGLWEPAQEQGGNEWRGERRRWGGGLVGE